MPPTSGRAPSPWKPSCVGVNHDVTVDIIRGSMYKQGLPFKEDLSSTRCAGLKQISRVGRSRYIADIRHLCGAGKESK